MSRSLIITLTDGKKVFSTSINDNEYEELFDYFSELQSNGSNPHMQKISFEYFTRPLSMFDFADIKKYNSNHFIYGWMECFLQSDESPPWILNSERLHIEVTERNL